MFKSAGKKLAHNTTIPIAMGGANETRSLQDLISAEKVALVSMQRLGTDFTKVAEALKVWGNDEAQGDDLADTTTATCIVMSHFAQALQSLSNYQNPIRDSLKSLRTAIENLQALKSQLRSLRSKADAAEKRLAKMSPEHKKLQSETENLSRLNSEIMELDAQVQREEKKTADMKREESRRVLATTFGGLVETCEKGLIIGEAGKVIAAEIPIATNGSPRPFYQGHKTTASVLEQTQARLISISLDVSLPGAGTQLPPPQQANWSSPTETSGYHSQQHPQSSYASETSASTPIASQFATHSSMASQFAPQSSPPSSPYVSGAASQPPYSGLPYPSDYDASYSSKTGTVDDFGVHLHNPERGPNSSQFATVPSKLPTQSHYNPPKGPPRLNTEDGEGDFATSIENALSGFSQRQYSPPPGPPPQLTRDDTIEAINAQHRALSPGRPEELNPWDKREMPPSPRYTSRPSSQELPSESGGLAYMSSEQDLNDPKHVTFGREKDVDIADELQHGRKSHEAQHGSESYPAGQHAPSVKQPTFPNPHDERALDAAAARQLSIEIAQSTPPLPPKDPSPAVPYHSQSPHYGEIAKPTPEPPFPYSDLARRSISPIDTRHIPDSPSKSPRTSLNRNPLPSSPITYDIPEYSPSWDRPPPSAGLPSTPTPEPPVSITPPFRTPMTTPSVSYTSRASPVPPPVGARTISAAAFKRQPRSTSFGTPTEMGAEGDGVGTPPLSFKKRLPSSSYLVQAQPEIAQPSPLHREHPRVSSDEDSGFDYIGAYSYEEDDKEKEKAAGTGYASGKFATNLERDNMR